MSKRTVPKTEPSTPLVQCIARQRAREPKVVVKAESGATSAGSLTPTTRPASSRTSNIGSNEPAEDNLDGPAHLWIKKWVSQSKDEYNKFYYRLNKNPAAKAEWMVLKRSGTEREARELVQAVLDAYHTTTKVRTVAEDTIKDDDSTWTPWHKAVEIEGEQQLMVMIKHGTIESRRHPKIPESDISIKWPLYLQVRLEKEVERKR